MSAKPLPKIDESVTVPPAVRAAAERASQIHNAAYGKPEEPAKEVTPEGNPEPEKSVEAAAPAPVEPAKEPAKVAAPADPDWEQRYRAMKGRFGQSERVVNELKEKIAGFEATLASMQKSPAPTAQPDLVPEIHITKKDIDEYGADFVDLARRAAREEAAPRIKQLEKSLTDAQQIIKQLSGQVDTTAKHVQLSARQQMFADLTAAVPNWKQLNNDPKFLDWLDLPDTYSGVSKSELLKAADAQNDTLRVKAFFQGFLAEEAARVPQDTAAPVQADPATGKVPLETFAAPGRAKSAPTPVAAEKPIFTRDQVTQFYVDSAKGRFAGREDEKRKVEAQIHQAGLEGRIR